MLKTARGYYGYQRRLEKAELEPKPIYPEGLPGGSGMSVPCFFLLYLIVIKIK